ncbi:lycopene beta-cyclase CrtY [Bdellovibrio reynosensis]|uniref:Lycopene beta-cyclase CrtY n=1 Tax=Bdellovibrio reynosensis TaxID=2835041 RepID=A0ABY4C512_9BACT|nr:lycopene beta-cyclase CrtY [Bdellovibrio reynosensis]UOF00051.1 lycopene beta-cyclase CrtY [Bdellovibrio reynosensis]
MGIKNTVLKSADVIIVGAGLSGCLMAWFLKQRQPELFIQIFEQSNDLPLKRTWSFHQSDVSDNYLNIKSLISKEWQEHTVHFASYYRNLTGRYASIRPEDLSNKIKNEFAGQIFFNTEIVSVDEAAITTADGSVHKANCIIDARGPETLTTKCGYQKFLGLHLQTKTAHGLQNPIIMDATVKQTDGYRFMYVLPWSETELLIEDTYYSESSLMDNEFLRKEILNYVSSKGWQVQKILDEETGVLPIPFFQSQSNEKKLAVIGARGGFFHPVTGYSLPEAVKIADRISQLKNPSTAAARTVLNRYRNEQYWQKRYFYLLNRLLFQAAQPNERFKIFERFYSLPESLIANFYRASLSNAEKIRILSGKPPVPVTEALKCLINSGV